tara:strand:- start:636 stop:1424 length:789 start_codon:yes stop_codon:yes gene_type:complete
VFLQEGFSQSDNKNRGFSLEKSIVVYSFKNKEKEKEEIFKIHQKLTSIGVDVVNYIDSLNIYTSQETNKSLLEYIKKREIKNTIVFSESNKSIQFFSFNFFEKPNALPTLVLSGDSVFNLLKTKIITLKSKQKNFLFSPQPEVLLKVKIKPSGRILRKPNLEKDKIGITIKLNINPPQNTTFVEEKDDYRFYFSNGINYVVHFYQGTEYFIQKTYNLENLNPTSNKKTLMLVLEHTATRNKYFYTNNNITNKEELLLDFLSN